MDFPELEPIVENKRIMCFLEGKEFETIKHSFEWLDEITRQNDEEFIKNHTEEFKKRNYIKTYM